MLELLGSRTLSGCQAAATMFVTTNSANGGWPGPVMPVRCCV